MRSPSLVSISVARPTSLPSLSLSAASAESGSLSVSAVVLAHPPSSIAAAPAIRSRLTVSSSPVSLNVGSVELGHEPRRLVPEALDTLELHRLVAADLVGQLRDGDGARGRGRVEAGGRRLDEAAVLRDEAPLRAPDLRVAEDVERRAAQAPQRPERLEGGREPGPELELLLEPEGAQQRRVQV